MIAKSIFNYLAAMILAYGIILLIPVIVDFVFDTNTEAYVITWCNVGLCVMWMKKVPFPVPDHHRLDIAGGLRALWWAIFWPNYLFSK